MEERLRELHQKRNDIEKNNVARNRILAILDEQSFVELGAFIKPRSTDFNMMSVEAPADGVVTGYGTIGGRLVYIFSQDPTVIGGSLGEMHGMKIVRLYDMAMKVGAPIIGLLDSAGLRLQEGTDAFEGYGQIYLKQSMASGVIPQFMAILGTCGGGAAMIPSLSDFVLMKKEYASIYLNSANTLRGIKDEVDPVGDGLFHSVNAGLVDLVCEEEMDVFAHIKGLISLMPSNNREEAPYQHTEDDLNRVVDGLNQMGASELDGREIAKLILDDGGSVELKSAYGEDSATIIGTLGGMVVGVIAATAGVKDKRLSIAGAEKIAAFVKKMDAFSIPIITLVDVVGFDASVSNERAGQVKVVASMLMAYTNATVPKVTVLLQEAIGTAYVVLNSKHIGADIVYAWPSSKVGTMGAEAAVGIMYSEEIAKSVVASEVIKEKVAEYGERELSPYKAASHGYVDDIIEPSATRKRLIAAVDMLFTKYAPSPDRKHSSV